MLQKSRTMNKNDVEYRSYRLCDTLTNIIIFGNIEGFSKTIEEVEEFINNYIKK